ncbi:MAG: DNA-3-methyladenine glycosylase I, partial [Candidatus Bathyarchaeia archaeon]
NSLFPLFPRSRREFVFSVVPEVSGGRPIKHHFRSMSQVPAKSRESDAMSEGLYRRGFKFVGSTICYAFMQAVGMVNDHTVNCFRYKQI